MAYEDIMIPKDEDILLEWDTLEYIHHERGLGWYITGAIITLGLLIYSILFQEWSMAITIALLAAVIYLYSHEVPKPHTIYVTKLGVHVGIKFFSYSQIRAFWLVLEPGYQALYLEIVIRTPEVIVMELANQDPAELRRILSQNIPEAQGREELFLSKLGRVFKI